MGGNSVHAARTLAPNDITRQDGGPERTSGVEHLCVVPKNPFFFPV